MEKQARSKNSSIHLFELIGKSVFLIISSWICKIQKIFTRFWFFLAFHLHAHTANLEGQKKNPEFDSQNMQLSTRERQEEGILSTEDAMIVIEKLGIVCSHDSKELQGFLSSSELSGLFEDQEPSLEEVKEAFHVFDNNREGFIDANKLQRVLCLLGFMEGSKLEDCEKMIKRFDENGDGSIDFNEFVKFMENSF